MLSLRLLKLTPLISSLLFAGACTKSADAPPTPGTTATAGGTLVISTPAEPDNLIPPITTTVSARQVEDLVFQHLADIGVAQNTVGDSGFTPNLAQRWDWSKDSLSIAFHLDPAARWHDGTPVRAADVAFTVALYRDPKTASPAATALTNVDSVSTPDSLTAVVWFKKRKPEQFFDVVYQVYVLPSHLLASADRSKLASLPFASQPVGSGPYRLVRWVPKQVLELAADTTRCANRALLDRVVFTVAPDPVTAFTRVATGEADVYEAVRPENVATVVKTPTLRLVIKPAYTYMYLGFNLVDGAAGRPHPIFGDRSVRRALTMATDRRSIVANIYDTLAVPSRGPFTDAQPSADATLREIPYAVDSANALLDAAGWTRGIDSLRRKNGKVLAFSMLVPSSSPPRMRAAVLLQEQFRRVGADVTIDTPDMGSFVGRMVGRKFDTMMGGWAPDPGVGSVTDTWMSAGAAPGGNNLSAYRSPAFDAQVDSGMLAFSPSVMRAHFAAAWRIIVDDAPAIWLAEPRDVLAINSRFVITGVRADAWWAGIPRWSIPAGKRIARDAAVPAAGAAR
jgi:peptide/nickel transport system substrate-binding protein